MLQKILSLLIFLSVLAETANSQNPDIQILREINLHRNTSFDGTFESITRSAKPLCIGIPACMLGLGLIRHDSVLTRNAIVTGTAVVVSTGLTTILKRSINRPRPYITHPDIDKQTDGGGASFPSGHTSGAFSLATSLSLQYPKWQVILPSYLWASAVAYSRMDLGVHYPSDVLAGAIVGAGSAYLCHQLNKKLIPKWTRNLGILKK